VRGLIAAYEISKTIEAFRFDGWVRSGRGSGCK